MLTWIVVAGVRIDYIVYALLYCVPCTVRADTSYLIRYLERDKTLKKAWVHLSPDVEAGVTTVYVQDLCDQLRTGGGTPLCP